MQIIIIREKQNKKNAIQQVNQNLISYIQQAYNFMTEGNTESLIFPIVPTGLKFPSDIDVENYKGVSTKFNVPDTKNLKDIEISSIFPVNKDYNFANKLANTNGWDYVDFLEERQKNQLPLRLLAYDFKGLNGVTSAIINNYGDAQSIANSSFKRHADGLFLVKSFDYEIDNVKDIKYTLTLSQFNSDVANYGIDWEQISKSSAKNVTTKYVLKNLGLI